MSPLGNAWSLRRSTIKRPPVCRSKPKPEIDWPPTIGVDAEWSQVDGMDISTMTQGTLTYSIVAPGPVFQAFGGDDQGSLWTGVLIMAMNPGKAELTITMQTGPFAGTIRHGKVFGWDGHDMWDSEIGLLDYVGAGAPGAFLLHIPG